MPAHEFFGQLINSIISIYWQGLHLGLLFRGGITFGRLYHDSKVVAGEALVRAVLLEKETRWPRIELEPCLIAQKDVDGNPMLDEFLREVAVVEHEGRYFLNTLAFHQGVWWDYNHFRKGDPAVTSREIIQAVENIKNSIMDRITMLEKRISSQGHVADNSSEYEALLKWRWFQSEFDEAQEHEIWRTVRQQAEQESKG